VLAAGPGLLCEVALGCLSREPGIRVVGQAQDEQELEWLLARHKPRVLVLDSATIGPDWVRWVSRFRRAAPSTRILVISASPTESLVKAALRSGASGVLGERHDFATLRKAVLRVGAGEIWADRRALGHVMEDFGRSRRRCATAANGLTARERQVSDCMSLGLRNKEIALRLSISEKTVKSHVYSIFRKLRVNSRFKFFSRVQPKS
jgi:DNA-binding NarL/FixJ family response regulator